MLRHGGYFPAEMRRERWRAQGRAQCRERWRAQGLRHTGERLSVGTRRQGVLEGALPCLGKHATLWGAGLGGGRKKPSPGMGEGFVMIENIKSLNSKL